MYLMQQYDTALQEILDRGIQKKDRTGTGCISVAGLQRRYPLNTGFFPIVTKRKMYPKSVWAELLWFIAGETTNQELEARGCKFWGKWCDETNPKYVALRERWMYEPGDFGPIYGWQLRHFGADYLEYNLCKKEYLSVVNIRNKINNDENLKKQVSEIFNGEVDTYASDEQIYKVRMEAVIGKGFDQLSYMVNILQNDPFGSGGRRCLFNLWNPMDLDKMSLPPCHYTYQAIPDGNGGLTGILTQRSNDFLVGVPANIQFYSALTIMLAQQANMKPVELIHETHDSHIYLNQINEAEEYLDRTETPDSPVVKINKAKDIYSYTMDDFVVENYNPLGPIVMNVSV